MSGCSSRHQPVLRAEVLELLKVRRGGLYIDATAGGGGHLADVMAQVGDGVVMGIDRDREAIERLRHAGLETTGRCRLVHGNFGALREMAAQQGLHDVDGVLMDVGVSSDQLDQRERGFSFQQEGPLDMRMDRTGGRTAADLVNTASEEDLTSLLREFGEERRARRIARHLVRARASRPFTTTTALAEAVEQAVGGRRGRIHPATRTFQALRIAVNDELGALRNGLDGALGLLRVGGRMGVISFHSLEDRIVKRFFTAHAGRNRSLPEGGSRWEGELPRVRVVTRKPVRASTAEQQLNPRSRSAKLRVAERTRMEDTSNEEKK